MTPHQEDILGAGVEIDEEPQISNALFTRISEDNWEKHEEVTVNYVDLKASIDDYYNENITHRDQTNKLVEASMNSLD
ncbi:hypothetical protein Tco_0074595, partial [Tanacetum coccineum]